jgi:hypothetical protein
MCNRRIEPKWRNTSGIVRPFVSIVQAIVLKGPFFHSLLRGSGRAAVVNFPMTFQPQWTEARMGIVKERKEVGGTEG